MIRFIVMNKGYELQIFFHNKFTPLGWVGKRTEGIYESFKTLKEIEPYEDLIDSTVKQAIIFDNNNGKIIYLKQFIK